MTNYKFAVDEIHIVGAQYPFAIYPMPRIIGTGKVVVDHDGLVITELVGNVASNEDTMSIAQVKVTSNKPTSEPWLTLHYDEWICVQKGYMVLDYEDSNGSISSIQVNAGQSAFISKGERFRPYFPQGDCDYIPVCVPAFRPDRCIREEGEKVSDVTLNLKKLHGMDGELNACQPHDGADPDVLYHMCQERLWKDAVNSGKAYYPPTFEQDGYFTHATAVPQRLLDTANHFYTETDGNWICLQLSRSALRNVGIITKDEEGLPVGDQKVSDDWVRSKWVCPHIYGGIPVDTSLNVLKRTFPMVRSHDGKFLSITGLTD
jgi:uncharacterized protein (DUF952 family)